MTINDLKGSLKAHQQLKKKKKKKKKKLEVLEEVLQKYMTIREEKVIYAQHNR